MSHRFYNYRLNVDSGVNYRFLCCDLADPNTSGTPGTHFDGQNGGVEFDCNAQLRLQQLKPDGTPKRPMNAFMIFARRRRPLVASKQTGVSTGDVSKILSKEWSEMRWEDKQFYLDQAKTLKDAFEARWPDYVYKRGPNNCRRRRRVIENTENNTTRDGETNPGVASSTPLEAPPLIPRSCGSHSHPTSSITSRMNTQSPCSFPPISHSGRSPDTISDCSSSSFNVAFECNTSSLHNLDIRPEGSAIDDPCRNPSENSQVQPPGSHSINNIFGHRMSINTDQQLQHWNSPADTMSSTFAEPFEALSNVSSTSSYSFQQTSYPNDSHSLYAEVDSANNTGAQCPLTCEELSKPWGDQPSPQDYFTIPTTYTDFPDKRVSNRQTYVTKTHDNEQYPITTHGHCHGYIDNSVSTFTPLTHQPFPLTAQYYRDAMLDGRLAITYV